MIKQVGGRDRRPAIGGRRGAPDATSGANTRTCRPHGALRVSAAFVRMLPAVGRVTRQAVAVASDPSVGCFLELLYARYRVEAQRQPRPQRDRQRHVDRRSAGVSFPVRCDRPRGRFALREAQAVRRERPRLLKWRHRHAMVTVQRPDEAHRPRSEPSAAVEDQRYSVG